MYPRLDQFSKMHEIDHKMGALFTRILEGFGLLAACAWAVYMALADAAMAGPTKKSADATRVVSTFEVGTLYFGN